MSSSSDVFSMPEEWSDFGARWGERDGLLYLSEWRRGFTVHELRAMWFTTQMVRQYRSDLARLERQLSDANSLIDDLEKRCRFYRDQLRLESTMGAMLHRIAGVE